MRNLALICRHAYYYCIRLLHFAIDYDMIRHFRRHAYYYCIRLLHLFRLHFSNKKTSSLCLLLLHKAPTLVNCLILCLHSSRHAYYYCIRLLHIDGFGMSDDLDCRHAYYYCIRFLHKVLFLRIS